MQEATTTDRDERWKEDREFCLVLFNKILRVPIVEEDIKRFARLGKMESVQKRVTDSVQQRGTDSAKQIKARPVLIQFRDRILKNMVMESVGKLKGSAEKYSRIIFKHDMNTKDREEYKRLVAEAKENEKKELSGEFLHWVKGAPGSLISE